MIPNPLRIIANVVQRFHTERCTQTAAALSFTTLLGLVPMVILGAVLIEYLPSGIKIAPALERFVLATLLPDKAGAVIAKYLGQFAHRAEHITWIGLGVLATTALMQIITIEHAFNAIWRVKSPRPWLKRLAMHLIALFAGPLVFGAALAGITYLAGASFGFFEDARWARATFAQIAPGIILAVLFALLYWALPNRRVTRWHAGLSGMLAALSFVGMQHLFALYVVKFPTYATLYGAFAALPIFLLWLHLSWSVILVGALLTAELSGVRPR